MRQINQTGRDDEAAYVPQVASGGGFGEIIIAVTRRHYLAIALSALLGMALGGVYSVLATPSFTASTKLFVGDPRAQSSPAPDTAFVGSQVELVRSGNVAMSVIRDLRLIDDPEFTKAGLLSFILHFALDLSNRAANSEEERARRALRSFKARTDVKQAGLTYIIEVSFRSSSAKRAAQIANAIAHAYIANQRTVKYDAAESTSAWLRGRIEELRDQASAAEGAVVNFKGTSDGQAQVELRESASKAKIYREIYDTFLQRYIESVQQQSSPVVEAQVISPALPPLEKSYPKTLLVLALTTCGGALFGFGIGLLRESTDRSFRTAGRVETALGTNCVAVIPIESGKIRDVCRQEMRSSAQNETLSLGHWVGMSAVVDSPFSQFAEAIRSIKHSAQLNGLGKHNKVIGVTSSIPREGKSTVAAAIAQLLACSGRRTILVDCDLRNPELSRKLCPRARVGLLEALSGTASLEEIAWSVSSTHLLVLPTITKVHLSHPDELFGSDTMKALFHTLRQQFDSVIVDLSSLAPVVDARATTHLVDGYLLVIEWGRTHVNVVQHALETSGGVKDNLLGAVLNKANAKSLCRYETHLGQYYDRKHFEHYHNTNVRFASTLP
jgi:capsular exopolysaccharide synthesis family protein